MTTYNSLTFSNFFQIIVNNTIYSRDVKSKCFKNLMKWSRLSMPTPQNLSPWINGKRRIAQDYTDMIKQDNGLTKVQKCIEENILPRLLSIDNTITELTVLLHAERKMSPTLKKQIYSTYTEPKLFISHLLYYTLTNDYVAPSVLPPKQHSFNLDLITTGVSLPKSRSPVWGRETDCKKIAKILSEHSIIFLWGVAGIGKSELAKYYVKTNSNLNTNIVYVPFNSSVKDSIANLHFIDDNVEDNTEKKYQNHLRHLYACDSNTVLLLDNFNIAPEDDANFYELINCGCQIIVTSRNKPIDYPEFNVKELNINACMELFNFHGPDNLSDKQIKSIIELVYAHTLLIVMVARTLKYTELEYDNLLQSLTKTITETPTQTTIPITKDEKTQSVIFEKYILNLLELANVSSEELDVLCTLALMPVDGIRGKQLMKYTNQDSANLINHLVQLGYITGEIINESKLYVHPLIGEVTIKKHGMHLESVIKNFISNFLFDVYKEKHYPNIEEQRIAISVFEWINSLSKTNFCYEVIDLISLFMKSGQFYYVEEAAKYIKHNLNTLKPSEITYINALSSYYPGMADVQLNMNESAHDHFMEASNLLADLTHYSLIEAELYFNSLIEAAASITDTAQSITALENIHINQYDLPDSTYKALIGRLNFKLGYKYLTQRKYDEAKIQFENCLQLRKALFGKDSLSVGLVYGNIGYLSQAQKNYIAAAENYEHALEILQKHLPYTHIEIIRLHTNLGITYSCISDEQEFKQLSESHFGIARISTKDIYLNARADTKYYQMVETSKKPSVKKFHNVGSYFSREDIQRLLDAKKHYPLRNHPIDSSNEFMNALHGASIIINKERFENEESK